MKLFVASLALAAAAVPAVADARPVPAVQQAAPADRLIALLLPDEKFIHAVFALIDSQVADDSKLPADRRALFAANPGLKAEVLATIHTDLDVLMRKNLPSLHTELAALVSSHMTPDELQQTLAMFNSPTGHKMLTQIYAGLANAGTLDEAEAHRKAMATMMASLTPEDYPLLIAFGQSAAAPKLQALTPLIQQASKDWAQRFMAANQGEMFRHIDAVIAARTGKKP